MNVEETLSRVCFFADDYQKGGKSQHRLFLDSGYASVADEISIELIASFLRSHGSLIGSWYFYSENKRTDRGWHVFFGDDDTVNSVELWDRGRVLKEERYADRFEACAAYVKHEFELLAS